jgi:hypothetical protein
MLAVVNEQTNRTRFVLTLLTALVLKMLPSRAAAALAFRRWRD